MKPVASDNFGTNDRQAHHVYLLVTGSLLGLAVYFVKGA